MLLVYVPQGMQVTLPTITTPIDRGVLATACQRAGLDVRVSEGVPGRWTHSMDRRRADERSERAAKQMAREATAVTLMKGAVDPQDRSRAEILERKLKIDQQLGEAKKQLLKAKSDAYSKSIFISSDEFQGLNDLIEALKQQSQAAQVELSLARQAQHQANQKAWEQTHSGFLQHFYDVAKETMVPEDFQELLAEVIELCGQDQDGVKDPHATQT